MMKPLLLLVISIYSFAFEVGPSKQMKVSTGDIIEVSVAADGPEDLRPLKNNRLGDQLYVLDADNDNRQLKVIVVDRVDPDPDEPTADVTYRNLVFTAGNMPQSPQYFSVESGLKLDEANYKLWIALVVALLLLGIVYKIIYPRVKQKKQRKQRREELRQLVQAANAREDFEKVYAHRQELVELFRVNPLELKEFEATLNTFQYRKEWTEMDFSTVKKKIDRLKELTRD